MKIPVAVTLIIAGALLVAAPIIADYSHRAQVASVMGKPGVSSVSIGPELSEAYRFGCWFTGSVMVAAAILFSRRSGS